MSILSKWLGPRSKCDKSLPYTYEARIDILAGQGSESVPESYFADTICGLIDYLDDNGIPPDRVEIFGVYRKEQIPLAVSLCVSADGKWLVRPGVCQAFEDHYQVTKDERYKGHVDRGACSYEDRDRQGSGPY